MLEIILLQMIGPWTPLCFHCGYVKGAKAANGIWVVNQAGQISREWYKSIYVATIDISKAFTSVRHAYVVLALKFMLGRTMCNSTDAKHKAKMLVAMVARILLQSRAKVTLCGFTSRMFRLMRGIPQGAPMSALLWALVMDYILSPLVTKWKKEVTVGAVTPLGFRM